MLDKETSEKLISAVIGQFEGIYSEKNGIGQLAQQIVQIAAKVSVATLQEYEKLKNQAGSSDPPVQ